METGFMNKITGLVIALVVGGLLVGGLLIPSVSGIQDTVGDKITKSNQVYDAYYTAPDSDYELTISNEGFIANGATLSNTYAQGVFANSFVVQLHTPTDENNLGYVMGKNDETPTYFDKTEEYRITFADNAIVINKTGVSEPVFTEQYTWAYAICGAETKAAWGTITHIGTDPTYILSDKQVYISGYYYTGENDTFYSYHDGVTYSGDYEGTAAINKTLVDGTTDIYQIDGLTVTIGDESFTPFLILVPLSVTGHATTGTYVVMFGVISILGIVALVVVAANGIRNKY